MILIHQTTSVVTMPLILFNVSTASMKSSRSITPAKPEIPYLSFKISHGYDK
jgi:hypothetical protein